MGICMTKRKVKDLKNIIRHFQPELVEGSVDWKFMLRKLKKEYVRGNYK